MLWGRVVCFYIKSCCLKKAENRRQPGYLLPGLLKNTCSVVSELMKGRARLSMCLEDVVSQTDRSDEEHEEAKGKIKEDSLRLST